MSQGKHEEALQEDLRSTTQALNFGFYFRAKKAKHESAGRFAMRSRGEHWLKLDAQTHGEYQSPHDRRELMEKLGEFFRHFGPVDLANLCEERLKEIPEESDPITPPEDNWTT